MIKKLLSFTFIFLLVLAMAGCTSNNNENSSTEQDHQTVETNSNKVNEYGIKESDMQDLYDTIEADMMEYFKEKGIDSKTFEWPSHSEEDIGKYWVIIRAFCNEYDALIQYDDMSLEKIKKKFEDYYKDKYFQDDTQLLMYEIGISVVRWTNEHRDVQDDIFMMPATDWQKILSENIDF